ncbi:hypothetical protein ACFX2C_028627 [Malus domestica]
MASAAFAFSILSLSDVVFFPAFSLDVQDVVVFYQDLHIPFLEPKHVESEMQSVLRLPSPGMSSTGLESTICLMISRVVLRRLVVVMIAPSDITTRQTTGKKMEFWDRRKTTWPFRMLMSESEEATERTTS